MTSSTRGARRPTYYFKADEWGVVHEQIEVYDDGHVLGYDADHVHDSYGGLTDRRLDLVDFASFAVDETTVQREGAPSAVQPLGVAVGQNAHFRRKHIPLRRRERHATARAASSRTGCAAVAEPGPSTRDRLAAGPGYATGRASASPTTVGLLTREDPAITLAG